MNIRIGNDIKMNLTIRGIGDYQQNNVKQIRCYLINTSLENKGGECHPKRFPREPFPQYYTPTKYTVHNCGRWQYHIDPCNVKAEYCNYGDGFHDYHYWNHYHGFGIYPGHFVDPCCHHHHHHCDPLVPGRRSPFCFLAPSKIAQGVNKIEAYFPARDQLYCGTYKLVVVLVLYEDGWEKNDLHTYTLDYGVVFNIVDNEDGYFGNIIIDLDTNTIHGDKQMFAHFGYSKQSEVDSLDIHEEQFTQIKEEKLKTTHTVPTVDNGYFWVVCNNPITNIKMSGLDFPYDEIPSTDGKLYYRSRTKAKGGYDVKITIE